MILVGLENCKPCHEMKAKHHELRYVEVPRESKGDSNALLVKKRMNLLGVHEFPVLLNDGMTRVLDMSLIEE